jgi:hypothetical protein
MQLHESLELFRNERPLGPERAAGELENGLARLVVGPRASAEKHSAANKEDCAACSQTKIPD